MNLLSRIASSKKDSKTVASNEQKKKTSKPRRPPAEDDDDRRRDKPPSRAHLTDEELVREWYVLYFFLFSIECVYPLNSLKTGRTSPGSKSRNIRPCSTI